MKNQEEDKKKPKFRNICFYSAILLMLLIYMTAGFLGDIGKHYVLHITVIIMGVFLLLTVMLTVPLNWSDRRCRIAVIFLAAAVRLLVFPITVSDDVNRYIFEGKVLHDGFNPYMFSPSSEKLNHLRDKQIWNKINHKDKTACYPPLIMYVFSKISLFGSLKTFKALMFFFDMASIFMILAILKSRALSQRLAFLYALNPIVIYSFAGEGHLDSIMIFAILTSIYAFMRKNWILMFLFFGISVQVKYITLPCILFLLNRKNLKYIWIAGVIIILPFIVVVHAPYTGFFTSLHYFAKYMASGAVIHHFFRWILGSIEKASLTCSILFFISLLIICFCKIRSSWSNEFSDPVNYILAYMTTLILFSPTVHFWYLSWPLAFIFVLPSPAWIYLSFASSLYLIAPGMQYYNNAWHMPVQAVAVIWVPFIILLIPGFINSIRKKKDFKGDACSDFSILIPTKNEEKNISVCINSIKRNAENAEIIVIDSNSADQTRKIAAELGAKVIEYNKEYFDGGGRGGQIFKGLQSASGDITVVLHADTRLGSDSLGKIRKVLKENPKISGGAIGAVFTPVSFATSMIEAANSLRALVLGISFGDQVQFFRTKPMCDSNLFPNIPLMEDVELSYSIGKLGDRVFMFGDCEVSARHWESGVLIRTFMILKLFSTYCIVRLFKKPDTVLMYEKYYKKN